MDGVGGPAVLFGGEREIEPRLRQARIAGERLAERLPRLVGHDAAGRRDQRLAVGRPKARLLAEQAQRLGIGVRPVLVALEPHVDRRQHGPALAIARLGDQMLLDAGDRGLDVVAGMGGGLAARKRLVAHLRSPEHRVERKRDRRNADRDERGGG